MDPISLALMGGSVASSLMGMFGDDDESKQYSQRALEELIKIKIPDPEQQKIALAQYYSTGQLSPEVENEIKADPSAFEQVVQNQKYSQAQNQALSQLQSLGEEGGLSLSDKADLQGQMIANANKDRANRSAITDEMARRGQLGSGMELQAQLSGAQSAGDRDAQARLQTLGGARDRALQAIQGSGELAGKLQNQDYQMQSDKASARDRINQFNTQNAQGVQQRNVAARNAAMAQNLENSQNIANSNIDLRNKQEQYNKGLAQQNFENQMQLSGAKANAYMGQATQAANQSNKKNQQWGAVGSGLGQMGTAYQAQGNWEKLMEIRKQEAENEAKKKAGV
jgi:hypothetical protein